ncbi:MAG: nucleoside monophosphate kinase [Candidatus Zophobacter franzmannii]|jgi:adenylate kinase|nr:nucleoside monophosphate kinase [Candidatus Zophobacter franzmannii]
MVNIVLIGKQGSGKGTQAKLLANKFNLKHINTGAFFRKHIADKTPLGIIAEKHIRKGELVPDKYVFQLIEESIEPHIKGLVFDGFPRTYEQAIYIVKRYEIDQIIFLDLPVEIARERITSRVECHLCGKTYSLLTAPPIKDGICDNCGSVVGSRADDKPEAIDKRLSEFVEKTNILIDFFDKDGIVTTINANDVVDNVNEKVSKIVGDLI